jgi:hypothetical protein
MADIDHAEILSRVCDRISGGEVETAQNLLQREYPFEPVALVERKYGELEATRIFLRDYFTDRYSGARLIFPGTLRLLSLIMPAQFPFHPNWKMSETHEAYWELSPTVDHVIPVSRGGSDSEENWVTTSMRRNSAKANWTPEELGWTVLPVAESRWDGLLSWFVTSVQNQDQYLANSHIRRWYRAASIATAR